MIRYEQYLQNFNKTPNEQYREDVQAFVDVKEAENAFSRILRETFHIEDETEIEEYLEDGYFGDLTHYSVIIKEVELK